MARFQFRFQLPKLFLLSLSTLVLLLFSVPDFVASFTSPSACYGEWKNCANAFHDDLNRATASATSKTGSWSNYSFSVPVGSAVHNVTVRADFSASRSTGYISVRVSSDGGFTFGPSHVVGGNTAERTFLIDVTKDVEWTPDKLNNLDVQVTCFKQGYDTAPKCRLDVLQVNVNFTPAVSCVRSNPLVVVKPIVQNGTVGALLNYTVNITNTDSAICNSTVFNITGPTVPEGWVAVLRPNVLPPLAPLSSVTTNISVTSAQTATPGDYNFTVAAIDKFNSSRTRNGSFIYRVVSEPVQVPFDFGVVVSPTGQNVVQGNGSLALVTVPLLNGTSRAVVLSFAGCPLFSNCSFSKVSGNPTFVNTGHPTFYSNFSVNTSSFTPVGNYTINITGTELVYNATGIAGVKRTAYYSLNVTPRLPPPFDFGVLVSPITGATIAQGNKAESTVIVALLSGASQPVSLSQSGCPIFTNCSFDMLSGNPTFLSNFNVNTTTLTTTGNYTINITGTDGIKNRTAYYSLNVTAA